MDCTPTKSSRADTVRFDVAADQPTSPRRSTRIKKPPPITPRRFNRFFTPRLKDDGRAAKASRKALQALSTASLNARPAESESARPLKRRRLYMQSPTPSLPSSPIRHSGFLSSSQDHPSEHHDGVEKAGGGPDVGDDDADDTEASTDVDEMPQQRTARYGTLGLSSRLTHLRLSGSRTARLTCGDMDWQEETADFYSASTDINIDHGPPAPGDGGQPPLLTLPFCATSCKTNSLVAIGDEEGQVCLIESANEYPDEFKKVVLAMKPHENAVMDLEFSEDDALLATASGDQTCQIIDVQAQKSFYALTGHSSSVKRIQFVPGSKDLLVSCSRDGTLAMWDTRIKLSQGPLLPDGPSLTSEMVGREPFKCIYDPHVNRSRSRTMGIRSDPSVTSICFVSPSQPNLFATASSSDSVVKLWDMRAKHKYRNKVVPISCTAEPKSHESHRSFGIASMAMSSNCSSLYALCRDHTVYAYSTAHLILGSAPEMSCGDPVFQPRNGSSTGLGPLYGFRHPNLQIGTFYNRIAVRKATDTNTELIAVGSSDDCAVVFPTASRYLTKANRVIPGRSEGSVTSTGAPRPRLPRIDSQSTPLAFRQRGERDDIPIYYYHGSPLIKGHNKEVTAVTWTVEGNLVSIGDDFKTRCWRQDKARARALRKGYDGDVERWASGWADVRKGFDDDAEDVSPSK
ncbi:hypothetical protein DV735_g1531, partial [Chaetothyriales sp. CBS 134920]